MQVHVSSVVTLKNELYVKLNCINHMNTELTTIFCCCMNMTIMGLIFSSMFCKTIEELV